MACDRDFGQIELKMRKQNYIYTPDEHIQLIKEVHNPNGKNCPPFIVTKLSQEDILDHDQRLTLITQGRSKGLNFSEACYIRVSNEYKTGYELSDEYDSLTNPDVLIRTQVCLVRPFVKNNKRTIFIGHGSSKEI